MNELNSLIWHSRPTHGWLCCCTCICVEILIMPVMSLKPWSVLDTHCQAWYAPWYEQCPQSHEQAPGTNTNSILTLKMWSWISLARCTTCHVPDTEASRLVKEKFVQKSFKVFTTNTFWASRYPNGRSHTAPHLTKASWIFQLHDTGLQCFRNTAAFKQTEALLRWSPLAYCDKYKVAQRSSASSYPCNLSQFFNRQYSSHLALSCEDPYCSSLPPQPLSLRRRADSEEYWFKLQSLDPIKPKLQDQLWIDSLTYDLELPGCTTEVVP